MTTFSPSRRVPLAGPLPIRGARFNLASLELLVTRLAIFFAVFPSLRPRDLFFTLSDGMFCLSAALLLLTSGFRLAPLGRATIPWMLAFVTLSVGLIVSSLFGAEPERALTVLAQYAFAYILLAYIIVRNDEAVVDAFVKTFVLGTVFVNAFGLLVYFTGGDDQFLYVTGSGRLASFMGNPNANANIIGLTFPFVLYLWFSGKWPRIYAIACLAILGYALIATSSVGGLLWSSAGLVVFIMLTINWRTLAGIAVCLAVAIPLAAEFGPAILPDTFELRVLDAAQSGDLSEAGTFSSRMDLIREAWGLVDEHILIGLGVDQYRVQSASDLPVHNIYLLLWAEGGLLALIGWLMLPQIVALSALSVFSRPGGRLVGATVLSVVAVFLLAAVGTAHMYARFWVVPLHLAMALLMVSWAGCQPASAPRRIGRPAPGHPAGRAVGSQRLSGNTPAAGPGPLNPPGRTGPI